MSSASKWGKSEFVAQRLCSDGLEARPTEAEWCKSRFLAQRPSLEWSTPARTLPAASKRGGAGIHIHKTLYERESFMAFRRIFIFPQSGVAIHFDCGRVVP